MSWMTTNKWARWTIKMRELLTANKEDVKQTLNTQSAEIKTAITKGGGNLSKMAYEAMKRLQPYLYAIEYSELDYEAAREYFATHFVPVQGACTALRKGDFVGRNLDYNFNYLVEFAVCTKPHNGRYASVGLAGSVTALDKNTIKDYSEHFKWMPFRMLDGINEHGLTANVNMLNPDTNWSIADEGTTPIIEQREEICSVMLVRYILDNFKNATDACEYIKNYVKVYPPITTDEQGNTHKQDLHFGLCDAEGNTYCLEFEGNSCIILNPKANPNPERQIPFVMTNHRLAHANYDFTNHCYNVDDEGIEPYGSGIERSNLGISFVRDEETTKSVLQFMSEDLKWTNCYHTQENPWLTEFVGDGVTKTDSAALAALQSDVISSYAALIAQGEDAVRSNGKYWHTTHTVVYDIKNASMQILAQEQPMTSIVGGEEVSNVMTIDCFKSLPATKEDVQNVDLSNVAKQGNNPNVSLSSMDDKLGNMVVASQAEVTESLEYINSQLV